MCHGASRMPRVWENFGELLCNPGLPAQGFTLLKHLGWCHHCPAPLRDAGRAAGPRLSSQDIPECAEPLRSPRMGVSITQEGSQHKVTQSQ